MDGLVAVECAVDTFYVDGFNIFRFFGMFNHKSRFGGQHCSDYSTRVATLRVPKIAKKCSAHFYRDVWNLNQPLTDCCVYLWKDLNRWPGVAVFRGELKSDRSGVVGIVRLGQDKLGIHMHL